jgi:hypothetical protein
MKLVNKFKKKTVVLGGDVLDVEAAVKLRHAGFVPGNKARARRKYLHQSKGRHAFVDQWRGSHQQEGAGRTCSIQAGC